MGSQPNIQVQRRRSRRRKRRARSLETYMGRGICM